MQTPLRVLIVDDNAADAALVLRALRLSGFEPDGPTVDTEEEFLKHLHAGLDIVITDYSLPQFSGLRALELLKQSALDVPLFIVSGTIGEETAVEAMRLGAKDYFLKDRLTRLGAAVEQAISERRLRRERLEAEEAFAAERRRSEAALRESEAQFRQVVESIHEVFWMIDLGRHRMIYVSPGYERIWGRTCESLYQAPESWAEAIHPEDRERVVKASREKQKRGDYDEIYRIRRPDGTVRWIRDRAFPVCDRDGRAFRVVGTAEDITEYRKLEEQYRHAQKLEAIGTLAGGIAHDFNNILTSINCYTELAKYTCPPSSPAIEHLDEVLRGAKRATDLVQQIMAFGRRHEPKRQPVRLQDIIKEALKLLRAATPATIEFDAQLDADGTTVLADATQVHQVIMNLGANAAHAMRDRPGKLVVRLKNYTVGPDFAALRPALRTGDYVLVSVSDTGHGIDAATLPRIFEPFFTTKGPGEGTGLGLSTVHGIMQAHDGAVSVYSTPGEGTTFHLYFPAYGGAERAEAPKVADALRGAGERILYVDDEQPLALLGKKVLERLNYSVDWHTSATSALDAFRARPESYDLVVTDQMMPGMTGSALAERVHAIRPEIPVILTTGFTATLTAEKTKQLGISRLMMKPLTVDSLGTCVYEVLSALKNK